MAVILPVNNISPQLGNECFVAPNATIVGDVQCGEECSFWFNSVVRGDVNSIRLGNRVNIQDGAVLHCTYQKTKTVLGNNVSVGHNAIVHGCTVHDNVLIGMGVDRLLERLSQQILPALRRRDVAVGAEHDVVGGE